MTRLFRVALAALACFSFCEAVYSAPKRSQVRQVAKNAPKPHESRYRKTPYVGVLAVDADSGRVLFSDKASEIAYPASITKLMTAFLVFDDIKSGRFSLKDLVVASPVKTQVDRHLRQPSAIGLKSGDSMTVDAMLKALMVKSANDCAIFLAEKCSGTMEKFVERMNAKARSLGMSSTKFYNPNGLPPFGGKGNFNSSTCIDLAKMAMALLKRHPEILKYTSLKYYDAQLPGGKVQRFVNHNNVMVKDALKIFNPDGTEAVDGLKTGYIDAGGSSVIVTGKRNGKRAIVIVLGSSSRSQRDSVARHRLSDALDAISF
ncbi:MAG: D-alanyl-D-alanine carboxypeptidase [Kiritimatiellae bacterium]|nr:D-alanyl-D-alanine carboxypeptidase [Kiritimatiellia bacterium]